MRPGLKRSRRAIGLCRDGREGIVAMAIFKKPTLKTESRKKRDIPQGLFQKCPGCNEVIHEIELNENLRVCPRCDYHFALSAKALEQTGTQPTRAVVHVSASSGARNDERLLNLKPKAKTRRALAAYPQEPLPYLSVLPNPTPAGGIASFASLGDVIIAEPKSM